MTQSHDKGNPETVNRADRWIEIQALSAAIARKDGVPTEVESALCGAVVRAREWLEELEATKELFAAHAASSAIEPCAPFVVRHYSDDPHPSLKGNGFDGLTLGDYRDEAEAFVKWINERIAAAPSHEQPLNAVAGKAGVVPEKAPAAEGMPGDHGPATAPSTIEASLVERACSYLQDLESPFTGIEADELCIVLRTAVRSATRHSGVEVVGLFKETSNGWIEVSDRQCEEDGVFFLYREAKIHG
jgi:hypothetical protein